MTQEVRSAIVGPPPPEKFGEQGRDDPTAKLEKMADEVAHSAQRRLDEMAPTVINRAPDSHPVSKEDQFKDWQSVIFNRNELKSRFQGLAKLESIGPARAKLMMRRWDAKHRKGIEK